MTEPPVQGAEPPAIVADAGVVTPAAEPTAVSPDAGAATTSTTDTAADTGLETADPFTLAFGTDDTPSGDTGTPADVPAATAAPEVRAQFLQELGTAIGGEYASVDDLVREFKAYKDAAVSVSAFEKANPVMATVQQKLLEGDVEGAILFTQAAYADPMAVITDETGNPSYKMALDNVLTLEAYYHGATKEEAEQHVAVETKRLEAEESPLRRKAYEEDLRRRTAEMHKAAVNSDIEKSRAKASVLSERITALSESKNKVLEGLKTPPVMIRGAVVSEHIVKKSAETIRQKMEDPASYLMELLSVRNPDGTMSFSAEKALMIDMRYNPAHDPKLGKGLYDRIDENFVNKAVKEQTAKRLMENLNIDPKDSLPGSGTGTAAPAVHSGTLAERLQKQNPDLFTKKLL